MSNVASVTTATTNTIVASANTAVRTLRPDLIALQEAVVGDGRYQAEDISGPGYQLVHQISSGAPPMDA